MKVLIADDHPLVRSGIKATLTGSNSSGPQGQEIEIVGEAATAAEATELIRKHLPDLITLDLQMPGMVADQFATQVRELHPKLKILVLTAHEDLATVKKLQKVRISGYMLKDEAPENLLQAVRSIGQGAVWFSQSVAHKMMGLDEPEDPFAELSARERQVLERIAQGKDNSVISEELSLAEQTVRNYASMVYDKIGVTSRVEAVVWARERGMG